MSDETRGERAELPRSPVGDPVALGLPAREVTASERALGRGGDMRFHGAAEIRGLNCPRSTYYDEGRFGRLFSLLTPLRVAKEQLTDLGRAGGPMDTGDNPDNPAGLAAGFTFLGQFVDHDITFDPTSSLERQVDPEAIRNFRTPSLELDSVYGAGPGASPHLYQRGNPAKLRIGKDTGGGENDLPRTDDFIALVGDPRNDENLIIAQLHLAFLKFHNRVVDELGGPGPGIFEEAQRTVRWHYQWILVHEFLPHIVGQAMVDSVFQEGRKFFRWRKAPFIPVEFAVAAYRFGHSQVRPFYRLRADQPGLPIFAAVSAGPNDPPNDLSGSRPIRPELVIQWGLFFALGSGATPQLSKRIDTRLSPPLFQLPGFSGGEDDPKSLAERNLRRSSTFGLPSGQRVARAMAVPPVTPEDLADIEPLGMAARTPLWFYVLREAERLAGGRHLGPVGGRTVAEVLIGLLQGDPLSYLSEDPEWTPDLFTGDGFTLGEFRMADLLRAAGVA